MYRDYFFIIFSAKKHSYKERNITTPGRMISMPDITFLPFINQKPIRFLPYTSKKTPISVKTKGKIYPNK